MALWIKLALAAAAATAVPAPGPHPRPSPSYNYCQADYPDPQRYSPLSQAVLRKVQVITRHGDRTSVSGFIPHDTTQWDCDDIMETSYAIVKSRIGTDPILRNIQRYVIPPKSPYSGATWPGTCVAGQVTAKGARQHMALGKAFRDIYITQMGLLSATLNPKETYVRSSNVWRTRQSAASLMSTMYPDKQRTQTLEIIAYPPEYETLFSQPDKCPLVKELNTRLEKDAKHVEVLAKHKALRDKYRRVLDAENNPAFRDSLFRYLDAVIPRFCHNLQLPSRNGEAITPEDVVQMQQAVNDEYALMRGGLAQSMATNKLEIGFFMGELLDALDNAYKFELYSGHDLSVHGLLGLLQSKDTNWPPYAANLVIEVWRRDKGDVVRILYNGRALETDWCDFSAGCPLDTYVRTMRALVPDLTKDCH